MRRWESARIDLLGNTKHSHRFGMQGAVSPPKPNEAAHGDFRWHRPGQGWPGALEALVPPEGSSGAGMRWAGKGALPLPVGAVPGVVCLPSGGGSLLLAAVPSSAIALCLLLAPRGAAGELAEKGASVPAALCGEILGRERRGWSTLGATAKLMPTSGRPQPLRLGGQRVPVRKQAGAVELWWYSGNLPLKGSSAPGAPLPGGSGASAAASYCSTACESC